MCTIGGMLDSRSSSAHHPRTVSRTEPETVANTARDSSTRYARCPRRSVRTPAMQSTSCSTRGSVVSPVLGSASLAANDASSRVYAATCCGARMIEKPASLISPSRSADSSTTSLGEYRSVRKCRVMGVDRRPLRPSAVANLSWYMLRSRWISLTDLSKTTQLTPLAASRFTVSRTIAAGAEPSYPRAWRTSTVSKTTVRLANRRDTSARSGRNAA